MSKYVVDGSDLTSLADAIRSKAGTSEPMTLTDMVSAIGDIPVGGDEFDWEGYWNKTISYVSTSEILGKVIGGRCYYSYSSQYTTPKMTFNSQKNLSYFNYSTSISWFLDSCAFYNCSSLEQVIIPKCNTMYSSIFYGCLSLREIYAPDCKQLTQLTMGYSAFGNISTNNISLTFNRYVSICGIWWNGVSNNGTFYQTKLGTSTYIPMTFVGENYSKTGYLVYSRATSPLSSGALVIANGAYWGSTITTISGENIDYVGQSAFYNCTSLTTISFPNLTSMSQLAFGPVAKLSYIDLPKTKYAYFTGLTNCSYVSLPEAEYVWLSGISNMNSVYLPKALSIAVYGDAIEHISAPECVSIVGQVGSPSLLSEIDLPKCKYVTTSAFMSRVALTSVSLPNCEYIGQSCFKDCTTLTELYLPNLKSISVDVVEGCTNLSILSLPIISSINSYLGISTTQISQLDLPMLNRITSNIFCKASGQYSVYENSIITSLSLPMLSFAGYGDYTYYVLGGMPNITELSLPNLIGLIGQQHFESLPNLESLYLPKLSFWTGNLFGGSTNHIYSLSLPGVITPIIEREIVYSYFSTYNSAIQLQMSYMNVSKLDLPNLEGVRQNLFAGNYYLRSLKTGISSINGNYLFQNCSTITTLVLTNESMVNLQLTSVFNNSPFTTSSYLNRYASIYVPDSLYTSYKTASTIQYRWVSLASRIMPMSSLPIGFVIGNKYNEAYPTSITWSNWLNTEFASAYGYYESNGSIFTSDGTQYISGITLNDYIVEDYEYELSNV